MGVLDGTWVTVAEGVGLSVGGRTVGVLGGAWVGEGVGVAVGIGVLSAVSVAVDAANGVAVEDSVAAGRVGVGCVAKADWDVVVVVADG